MKQVRGAAWVTLLGSMLACGGQPPPAPALPAASSPNESLPLPFPSMRTSEWVGAADAPASSASDAIEETEALPFSGLRRPPILTSTTTVGASLGLGSNPPPSEVDEPYGAFVRLRVLRGKAKEHCENHELRGYVASHCELATPRLDYVDDGGTAITRWYVQDDGALVEATCSVSASTAVILGKGPSRNRPARDDEKRDACANALRGSTWKGHALFPPPPVSAPPIVGIPRQEGSTCAESTRDGTTRKTPAARELPGYTTPGCLSVRADRTWVEWTGPHFTARLELILQRQDGETKAPFLLGARPARGEIAKALAEAPLRITELRPITAAAVVPVHGGYMGFRCAFQSIDGANVCEALHKSLRD